MWTENGVQWKCNFKFPTRYHQTSLVMRSFDASEWEESTKIIPETALTFVFLINMRDFTPLFLTLSKQTMLRVIEIVKVASASSGSKLNDPLGVRCWGAKVETSSAMAHFKRLHSLLTISFIFFLHRHADVIKVFSDLSVNFWRITFSFWQMILILSSFRILITVGVLVIVFWVVFTFILFIIFFSLTFLWGLLIPFKLFFLLNNLNLLLFEMIVFISTLIQWSTTACLLASKGLIVWVWIFILFWLPLLNKSAHSLGN